MLAAERMAQIMEILNEQRSVKVEELAQQFGVSEMTIRRDLEKCRRAGVINRCHGGAIRKEENTSEVDYADKRSLHLEEKRKLATFCATLVQPGDSVYLDAGTTVFEIARLIRRIQGVTAVTNDLEIALLLSRSDVEVHVLGGAVQKSTVSMLGEISTRAVEQMSPSIAFVGAASINDNLEVMTPTMEKAFLKRTVAQRANQCYLVVDASKFHRQALYKINHLSEYSGVVTTKDFTALEQHQMLEQGIQLMHIE